MKTTDTAKLSRLAYEASLANASNAQELATRAANAYAHHEDAQLGVVHEPRVPPGAPRLGHPHRSHRSGAKAA
ncbi:MAG: hypothetical protein ABSF03_16235 [Streptosporangiaceae bacterium]|jgi:hypothetical protein